MAPYRHVDRLIVPYRHIDHRFRFLLLGRSHIGMSITTANISWYVLLTRTSRWCYWPSVESKDSELTGIASRYAILNKTARKNDEPQKVHRRVQTRSRPPSQGARQHDCHCQG